MSYSIKSKQTGRQIGASRHSSLARREVRWSQLQHRDRGGGKCANIYDKHGLMRHWDLALKRKTKLNKLILNEIWTDEKISASTGSTANTQENRDMLAFLTFNKIPLLILGDLFKQKPVIMTGHFRKITKIQQTTFSHAYTYWCPMFPFKLVIKCYTVFKSLTTKILSPSRQFP